MGPLDETIINSFLRKDVNGKVQKEDDKLEYKEFFENTSKEAKAKYAKEMAALYNYEGGYLIFGVNDDYELVGLQEFDEPDNAHIVDDLAPYFSPTIRFQSKLFTISDRKVFVIYVERRSSIPTVCVKSYPGVLNDATIYWRYSAKSAPIHAGDLISLMRGLQGEQNVELTDITRKQFRTSVKPKLRASSSGFGGGSDDFTITVENDGQDCTLDSFEQIEGKQVRLNKWQSAIPIAKGRFITITGTSLEDSPQYIDFKVKLQYHDDGDFYYESIIHWMKGSVKIVTTEL